MFPWNLGELNPEQEIAIVEPSSVFLIACPGSGKTRTLTYKIAYELSRLKSNKQYVVAITYTNRAADEIHERIENIGVDTSQLWIGTIHSFCLEWILKPYGIYHVDLNKGFRVIDPHESEKILVELCKPYSIKFWDCGYYITETGYELNCSKTALHNNLHKIYAKYFAILREKHQIDFELILYYAYQLITENPSISLLLSKLFSFVLIDEYQDTKHIQYLIISSILKSGLGNTRAFIVGDPNQAIYESLGGYPIDLTALQAMAGISFKELELSKNYRSSERIINYFSNYNVQDTQIQAASKDNSYTSLISYNKSVTFSNLEAELVRLIKFNITELGIEPHEICVLAPHWIHLASMTRRLVASMPEYEFDGPGMTPFARNIENFWYKLSKIALTQASPDMYIRRLRWAGEILKDLEDAGVNISALSKKSLLKECNSIVIDENNGLTYLRVFFEQLFARINIDFQLYSALQEHYEAFFNSSHVRIEQLKKDGSELIADITAFRKVFKNKSGITISTIHGIKGAEFDTVIAFALLEGFVPFFNDNNGEVSAKKLLYVIGSRARKNLHLISERERYQGFGQNRNERQGTTKLVECIFDYNEIKFNQ